MELKKIIGESGFKFNKRFGQNFIENDTLLRKIVELSGVSANDKVVEIGVGGGTLTRAISEKAKFVYGFEIDKNLKPVLQKSLAGVENAEIIFKDFMKENLSELEKEIGEEYVVVANLPYYITSPIVMRFIEEAKLCRRIVIMVQKEVAFRFCAQPSTADYGAITAAIGLWGESKIILDVDRTNFYPQPNVDSAVVRIDKSYEDKGLIDKKAYRDVVRAAFSSRRKTLANNMINCFKISRDKAESILSGSGIEAAVRGETLSVEDFIRLANFCKKENIV
ncbi:MAG TPA: ribosomal RNA small subunit methyltransferase A [Clostridiales bacterium]|nr:ribosomal RNA small subunit methyltransferase A [Clostridiales bacterium]